jgi:ATP-dependent RNA helicase RhlE
MSLVCVDELKLLKDIERLVKREIPKVVIEGYEPDLSIKPEPIQNGRNRGDRSQPRKQGQGRGRSSPNRQAKGASGRPGGNAANTRQRDDVKPAQKRSGNKPKPAAKAQQKTKARRGQQRERPALLGG